MLAAVLDTATYTSTKGVALEDDGQGAAKSMIHMDPPEHTRMRKLISRRFTPRRIAELEENGARIGRRARRALCRAQPNSTS